MNDSVPFSVQPSAVRPAFRITGVPAGERAVVAGCASDVAFGGSPAAEVSSCAGHVSLLDVDLVPTVDLLGVPMRTVIDIRSCASVTLTDVHVWPSSPRQGNTTTVTPIEGGGSDDGIAAVHALTTNLIVERSQLRGYDNFVNEASWGGDALRVRGASLARVNGALGSSALTGGASSGSGGSAVHWLSGRPVNALACGSVTLTPGAAQRPGGELSVIYDRGRFGGGFRRIMPSCLHAALGAIATPNLVSIGSQVRVDVSSPFGRPFHLFLGPPMVASIQLRGFQGTALLDYTSPLTGLLTSGTLAPGTPSTVVMSIPNAPILLGWHLGLQALMEAPTGLTQPAWSWTLGEALILR